MTVQVENVSSLTELNNRVGEASLRLSRHTTNRAALYKIATGDFGPGYVSLSGDEGPNVVVKSDAIDGTVIELLIRELITHEEQRAIACWQEIYELTNSAKELIEKIHVADETNGSIISMGRSTE